MIKITAFSILILGLSNCISAQCDEYYINELISGVDDNFFPEGSPVRFCPNLKGMAINGNAFDVTQWSGISTQYLTLTRNGGIAGNVVLKLNEKKLYVDFTNGWGSRVYSISLSKSEYQKWLVDKPNIIEERKKELIRIQNQKNKEKQDSINISNIRKNKLKGIYKVIDSSSVNDMIRLNYKFSQIIKYADLNSDTLIIDYIKQDKYSRPTLEWHFESNPPHMDGYQLYDVISRFFEYGTPESDTLIDGYRIPLEKRLIIIRTRKNQSTVESIEAPIKLADQKLYYLKKSFSDKYVWAGYF
jgi:hypothetical protein